MSESSVASPPSPGGTGPDDVVGAPVGGPAALDGADGPGETAPVETAPADPSTSTPDGGDPPGRGAKVARLEEEGEIAADYLEELLDIVDLDGDIDLDVHDGRAVVSVVAEGGDLESLERLAGQEGQVLEALQELTRLAVQARTGERSRLVLDVAGYRARRRAQLETLVADVISTVSREGDPVELEPMNPFERKVIHDAVAAAGLVSDSEGVEPARYVVVHPAAG